MLTEEDADDFKRLAKDKVFIIDPLDGTADFVRRDGQFAINLAFLSNHGEPVVGVVAIPTTGDIYFAVKGHGAFLKSPDKMLKRIHVSYRQHNLIVLASVCFPNPNLDAQIDKHALRSASGDVGARLGKNARLQRAKPISAIRLVPEPKSGMSVRRTWSLRKLAVSSLTATASLLLTIKKMSITGMVTLRRTWLLTACFRLRKSKPDRPEPKAR